MVKQTKSQSQRYCGHARNKRKASGMSADRGGGECAAGGKRSWQRKHICLAALDDRISTIYTPRGEGGGGLVRSCAAERIGARALGPVDSARQGRAAK